MGNARQRKGYALLVTLCVLMVAGGISLATVGFVARAARQTRIYLARSRCRFAAQSVIELSKARIQKGFSAYAGGSGAAAIKVDPRQAEVYDWFDSISGDRKTIGKGSKTVTLEDSSSTNAVGSVNGVNGCRVYVAIGRSVQHASKSSVAIVPIVATAVCEYPDGLRVTATIQERVIFGTGQSQVFDYAYFVNNYGWMSGSTITINGDLRANGDVSLSQATVNGFVYAAANDELGVDGSVSLKSSPQIKSQSAYRSSAGSRGRPDKADYDTSKSFDAPKSSGTIVAPTYSYDADGNEYVSDPGTVGSSSGKSIVNAESDSLPMPYVSELDNYVAYAKEYNDNRGGTLKYPKVEYTDSLGSNRTVNAGTVYAHYSGTGPSGDATAADKGALVLVGTASSPIVIDGPVVVDSDVVIKGYVSGQGTIYSGRNIHVVGDIKYVNAPSWSHVEGDDDEAAEASNAQKDMLGLVAKGNVVVGDSSSDSWHSDIDSYINGGRNSVVNSYACDDSDKNIGYPATFGGNYTAVEQVPSGTMTASQIAGAVGGYDTSSGQFGKVRSKTVTLETYSTYYDRWGRQQKVYDTKTVLATSYDRRYYETVCDDAVLKSFAESRISQIDAIMYNNHGTFGKLGGTSSYGYGSSYVNINGSLVCRDEALIYNANGLRFNWDFRLRGDDSETSKTLGLPVGPQDPYTYDWLVVPDSVNPAYVSKEGDL